jgi:hypothetical protein
MIDISASILAIVVYKLFLESISLCFCDAVKGISPFNTSTYLSEHLMMGKVG